MKKAIFLIACFCSVALGTKNPGQLSDTKYPGPLGLKWGMNYEEVDSVLSVKYEQTIAFRDRDGSDSIVRYKGDFAGYPDAEIETMFFNDSLISVCASIPKQNVIPISKTWFESVNKMESKYGKMDSIVLPPKKYNESKAKKTYQEELMAKFLDAELSDYEFWDKIIETEKWQPLAYWKFKNTAIIITIHIGKPDEYGNQDIKLIWEFFEPKSILKWRNISQEIENKTADY